MEEGRVSDSMALKLEIAAQIERAVEMNGTTITSEFQKAQKKAAAAGMGFPFTTIRALITFRKEQRKALNEIAESLPRNGEDERESPFALDPSAIDEGSREIYRKGVRVVVRDDGLQVKGARTALEGNRRQENKEDRAFLASTYDGIITEYLRVPTKRNRAALVKQYVDLALKEREEYAKRTKRNGRDS